MGKHRTRTLCKTSLLKTMLGLLPALLLGAIAAPAQVVINEIDYDQPSTDTAEFVELKNVGLTSVDLDPYTLELVNGNGGGAAVYNTINLPSFMLAPGDYYVICANAATVANCDLDSSPNTDFIQNGAPDGVGLRLSGTLVDAVSYEGNTGAPYTEGSGTGLEDLSTTASAGISRCPDGVDTGANNVDLSFQTITPGTSNACPVPALVINEIDYDQPGSDTAEFIEIKNVGSSAVNLGTISLQLINGNGGGAVAYATIALPAVNLVAGDYFVVCADAATVANCDLDTSPNTDLIQNGAPDAVAVVQGATLLDTVSYEGDTGAPYTEGSGSGLEDSSGAVGSGISRCADGADTGVNNVDLSPHPITPGVANDCGTTGGGELVINEIDYDQPSTDTAEFIEIKNVGTGTVNLAGFALTLINGSGTSVYSTIVLPSVNLAAGDYFVVCANAATVFNCDLDVSPDSNLIQNGAPDAVALTFGATIVDTVSYEGDTGAPYTEGSGTGLEDPGTGSVGGPDDNKGISRFPDGTDTDVNNVDLITACITPGAANTSSASSCPAPGPPALVINEIDYDQPGTDTAEFIEIKNVGSGTKSLAGVDLVLVNGNGGGAVVYSTFALPSVNLAAGDYFVVCGNAANVVNCDLDVSPDSDLIQNGAPDAVALFFGGTMLLDAVSYEGNTGAPYTEGSGTGLEDPGTAGEDFKGISRFPDGTDTAMNNVDLITSCISPGGANTDRSTGCTPTGPVFEIYEIQGSGLASPFDGSAVTTLDNVVTCLATDGFFMQTPTARTDGVLATSDGIFVFTGGAPSVIVGDIVKVTGLVDEFFGFTELTGGASVTVTGHDLAQVPAPVAFNASVPSPDPTTPSCGAFEFECYESMRVEVAAGTVAAANQSFGSDPFAEFHGVARSGRVFREPGIEFPGLVGFPIWDSNPEAFEVDPDKLGLPNQVVTAGSSFSATGVIGFEFNHYELWPNQLTVTPAPLPVPVRTAGANELTIGSLNMFRFFDDINDPADTNAVGATRDDTVVSLTEYLRRRAKFATYIVDVLRSPSVLAVQEAEKLGVLQDLAGDINALDPSVNYTAYLVEGNDVGTIDVGFLVRDNIVVSSVTQLGAAELFTTDVPPSALHDRPPLLLEGTCDGFPFAVMVVHMRSLGGIEDPSTGPRIRQKRYEQAVSVAQKIQNLQTLNPNIHLAVVGDYNAFEFTDGFVDVAGIMKGNFVPADNWICNTNACLDEVNPDFTDQVLSLPADQRYSFIFQDSFNPVRSRGDSQVLDHALTSPALTALVTDFEYGRGNCDAAAELVRDDGSINPANLPLRSSDHDGLVLYALKDADHDSVADAEDACPGTVIPEGIPQRRLGELRYALVNNDRIFDTKLPHPGFNAQQFNLDDTAGCSCEQIVAELQLGLGHLKFGCSLGAMSTWVALVSQGN